MLRISEAHLDLLRATQNEIILGIITAGEEIRLAVADRANLPGHREWQRRDAIRDDEIMGAFSVHVKNGRVQWLYPRSALNREADGSLPSHLHDQLLSLLPQAPGFKELED